MLRWAIVKKMIAGSMASVVNARTSGVLRVLSREQSNAQWEGLHRGVAEQQQGQQVGVPAGDEGQHADRDEARAREGEHDPPEEAEAAGPVDRRRVFQLDGDGAQERHQDDDRHRQLERDLRDDHPSERVDQAQSLQHQVQRQDRDGDREQ